MYISDLKRTHLLSQGSYRLASGEVVSSFSLLYHERILVVLSRISSSCFIDFSSYLSAQIRSSIVWESGHCIQVRYGIFSLERFRDREAIHRPSMHILLHPYYPFHFCKAFYIVVIATGKQYSCGYSESLSSMALIRK